jgi:N-acetylmuramoyl-L-alanine amidase CwlA
MNDPLARLTDKVLLLDWSDKNWGHSLLRGESPSYLTVHETGNTNPGADAEMHAKFVKNGGGEHSVSFHAVVDEYESWQMLQWNWVAWHASDGGGDGNYDSVAIETCQIGDFGATCERLAQLLAKLRREFGIPQANIRQHHDWAPDKKNCPQYIRSGRHGVTWESLLARVAVLYGTDESGEAPASPSPYVGGWQTMWRSL